MRIGLCLTVMLLSLAPRALADASAYCARVSARADSDATLLWAPRLTAQGLRYPSGFDIGPATPSGYQLRLGVAYSLIDPLRALQLQAAAETECAVEQTRAQLEALLEVSEAAAQRAAFAAQAEFLRAQKPQIDELVARARTRLREHVITVFELNNMLDAAEKLERKAVQADFGALGPATKQDTDAAALSDELVQRRDAHEERLSAARALDAWGVRLQAGVIPTEGPKVDWFGWLELSYNLGGPFQNAAEARYRAARQAELLHDPHELPAKRTTQREAQQARAAAASAELRAVDKRLQYLQATLTELDASDPTHSSHARDALSISQLSATAERVYLQRQIDALTQQNR